MQIIVAIITWSYEIVFARFLVITIPHSRFASRRVRGEGLRDACKLIDTCEDVLGTCGNRWSAPMHELPCTSAVQNEIWKRPKPSAINDMELPTERTIVAYINSHAGRATGASDGRTCHCTLNEFIASGRATVRFCHATGRFSRGIYAPTRSLYLHSIFSRSRQRWFRLWKWDD